MSEAKVALGKRLFFEPRLSVTGQYSCASCHDPALSYSDGRPLAVGATGEALPHSAMALVNVAYNISYGWTRPELTSLEAQMLEPLLNQHPVELGAAGREKSISEALANDATYVAQFIAAFPAPAPAAATAVTFDHLVKAIASFERTLIFGNSDFDRYVFGGEHDALSPEAKHGMALFFSPQAGCASCHSGFNFSGNWRDSQGATGKPSFANNGTSAQPMRVPTLRDVAVTAPYMHDGRFSTLTEVVNHYAQMAESARRDPQSKSDVRLRTFELSAAERADLIVFLHSLTARPTDHPASADHPAAEAGR